MNDYRKILLMSLCLVFFVGACVGLEQPSNKIEFYTLEYQPPQMNGLRPISPVIRIERFGVAPPYNTNRIIYRDKSFRRDAYVYHKWRISPGDLVTYSLGRDMKESGLFKAVLSPDSRIPSSHILEGTVEEFFEWDAEDHWQAILSVSIGFMSENNPDPPQERILFQKTYRSRQPCRRRNPRALAEAMSQAMADVSEQIIKDVYAHLKDGK